MHAWAPSSVAHAVVVKHLHLAVSDRPSLADGADAHAIDTRSRAIHDAHRRYLAAGAEYRQREQGRDRDGRLAPSPDARAPHPSRNAARDREYDAARRGEALRPRARAALDGSPLARRRKARDAYRRGTAPPHDTPASSTCQDILHTDETVSAGGSALARARHAVRRHRHATRERTRTAPAGRRRAARMRGPGDRAARPRRESHRPLFYGSGADTGPSEAIGAGS